MATVSVTNTFVNGTTADADQVNTNFSELVTFLNNSVVHRDGSKAMSGALDMNTSNKIINTANPTNAQDVATKAYVDALTYAANSITTAMIQDNAITNAKLATGVVDTDELAADAVTTAKIAAGAVDTTELANDAVTNAKIAAGAVDTTELATDAVTAAKIAAGAVDTSELATDAVTNAKMANNSVDTAELVNLAVTTAKIANNSVDETKLDYQLLEDVGPTSSTTITATTEGTAHTICSQNVTCAAGSLAIITGSLDILVETDPFDVIVGLLFINGTREPGRLVASWPDWNAATLNGSTYGRDVVERTWIVSMPAMSADTVQLRVYKAVNNGGSAKIQATTPADDVNSRLQILIFNA